SVPRADQPTESGPNARSPKTSSPSTTQYARGHATSEDGNTAVVSGATTRNHAAMPSSSTPSTGCVRHSPAAGGEGSRRSTGACTLRTPRYGRLSVDPGIGKYVAVDALTVPRTSSEPRPGPNGPYVV